jgi:site-specific DNA-methyltransferase (adenine-specific)
MRNEPIPRLDSKGLFRERLLPLCRLKPGETWIDPAGKHRVACVDVTDRPALRSLMRDELAVLAVQDPPYNLVAFEERELGHYIEWSRQWVAHTEQSLAENASMYIWLGADQRNGFQPLPDFMVMMRDTSFRPRSFITMRNQRGYGTLKNWMAVRQELLYYTRGEPVFNVAAEYTDIPKILRGYYKEVNGVMTENLQRGRSENIRAGNVWVDIQQVFYRMEENVNGCYAQKPLKSAERIIAASSNPGNLVVDFFSHSGSTLMACEMLNRRCYTAEIDPIFCEITIRRLEHFRSTGQRGWQNSNPFAKDEVENASFGKMIDEGYKTARISEGSVMKTLKSKRK